MTLSTHVDSDYIESQILAASQTSHQKLLNKYVKKGKTILAEKRQSEPDSSIVEHLSGIDNKYKLGDNEINPSLAYHLVHDSMKLDGTTTLNLASFVNVHIDAYAHKLVEENLTKNLADNDEYPMLIEIQSRCVSILADLWNAPTETVQGTHGEQTRAIGTACTGSSEAVMLGGLAMKKNWQARRRKQGKDTSKPNILMASCCQVALEKFARYFDVEARIVPVSKKDFLINYDEIRPRLDENTIGIFVIMGSTYTGGFESVKKVSDILDKFEKETGNFVPIHVDGASGAIIASIMYPDLEWDFRNPRVMSINTSGHKFGLTTAGLGWAIFRTKEWLPEDLKFQLDYLGGVEESFSLNFSRPGFQVVHQYYNFLRLGRQGYKDIYDNCLTNARILSLFLEDTGYFKCISNLHLPAGITARGEQSPKDKTPIEELDLSDHSLYNAALPVVSFQLSKDFMKKYPEVPQSTISKMLRNKKWIVPNYSLPRTDDPTQGKKPTSPSDNNEILRVVVKMDLQGQLLDKLMHDIVDVTEVLMKSVKIARDSVTGITKSNSENREELGEMMVYDMLLSLSNDADPRLLKLKKDLEKKHKTHAHISYRGAC